MISETGKYDYSQYTKQKKLVWKSAPESHSTPTSIDSAPTSEKLQSTVTTASDPWTLSDGLQYGETAAPYLGTFFVVIGACLLAWPGMTRTSCWLHNSTEIGYNSTKNYDCNMVAAVRQALIGGFIGVALCGIVFFASRSRLDSNKAEYGGVGQNESSSRLPLDDSESKPLITENDFASYSGPRVDKLKWFLNTVVMPQSMAVLAGMALSLFTSPAWVASACERHNTTQTGYNNTDIFDCNLDSVQRQSWISGAVFVGLGALTYFTALVLYKLNGRVARDGEFTRYAEKSLLSRQDSSDVGSTEADIGEGGELRTKYPLKYVEAYIEAYTTKFREEYDQRYKLAATGCGYTEQEAHAWADPAKNSAHQYAQAEAPKRMQSAASDIMSAESDLISLKSGTETGSATEQDLIKMQPIAYQRYYLEEYVIKFGQSYGQATRDGKEKAAEIAHEAATTHAKGAAMDLLSGRIALLEDRSMYDEVDDY